MGGKPNFVCKAGIGAGEWGPKLLQRAFMTVVIDNL